MMDSFISEEVRAGLDQARKRAMKSNNRMCVHVGEKVIRIGKTFDNGFAISVSAGTDLRGLVNVFDGPKHLYQCLIVCAEQVGDEIHYEYKRTTDATAQPPVDFVRAEDAPIALLER
jgi:hypothetical protein